MSLTRCKESQIINVETNSPPRERSKWGWHGSEVETRGREIQITSPIYVIWNVEDTFLANLATFTVKRHRSR